MAKRASPSLLTSPRAAVQPINGGNAPGTAPAIVFSQVTRFKGV